MPLTADEIRTAFGTLALELARDNTRAEIVIAGGAALVLLFEARKTTKDVDAYFVRPEASVIRAAAARVAQQLSLPDDWLNDGAKGYFVGLTSGAVLHHSSSLVVRSVGIEQLLAMKLAAWRDAVDRSDARLILTNLPGGAEEIWTLIEPFVPPAQLTKARYAFEDLWESLHEPA
jgi:hypothetical protein